MTYLDCSSEISEVDLNITAQEVVHKPRKLKSIWTAFAGSKVPKSTGKSWKSRLILNDKTAQRAADDLRNFWK